jgi:oligopeptide transport system substrate-binding protein
MLKKYLKNNKTIVPVFICLIFFFVNFAGCTPGVTTTGTGAATATPSGNPSSTVPGVPGGTLHLVGNDPITLDPAVAVGLDAASYIIQIFSGLVSFDANLNIIPDIAQNWDLSSDGKTYTFHLKPQAKFQSGKQITAADFKYSWERALNPALQSLQAPVYLNDIVGSSDMIAGKATQLSGVTAIDNTTLQVSIDAPKAYFLNKMAFPTAFVVDKSNVQSGATWFQKPNGSGPFQLKSWQKDKSVILVRNDNYYGTKALLNEVDFSILSGNPIQLYQNGQIDVSPVSAAYLGLVTDPSNAVSKELNLYKELSVGYVGFNVNAPPFDDPKVRQAFCYAVDKAKLISLSLQNVVAVAGGILPPGMPGYNPDLQSISYDPVKARQLIAESKYGSVANFPPIILTTQGYGNDVSGYLGGVLQQWQENLGVEVSVRQLETDVYYYFLGQEVDSMFDYSWIADYPDAQDFLDVLLGSGQANNYGNYNNPQFNALLNQAAVNPDRNLRLQQYQQAEQIALQDGAMLPLNFGQNYTLVKPYVKGYAVSSLGFPSLSKVSIQK